MALVKQQPSETVGQDERKRGRDRDDLELQLSDPNPAARRWAVRDLLECPGSSVILVEHLHQENYQQESLSCQQVLYHFQLAFQVIGKEQNLVHELALERYSCADRLQ